MAYALGWLSFAQLLVVSVVSGAADITFRAASGACLKALVPPGDMLAANARMESTTWTATVLGPPLGGAAIGLFGPVTTVLADAVELPAVRHRDPRHRRHRAVPGPGRTRADAGRRPARRMAAHPDASGAAPAVPGTLVFNGLIMATEPLLAVLMLGHLGFAPWQYGLAFAIPCTGGLIGSRLSPPAGRAVRAGPGSCWPAGRCGSAGCSGWASCARARPGSSSSWSSSSG